MTVERETRTIAGVPALLSFQGTPEKAAERGTVVFYHGFHGSKESAPYYREDLAAAGFLVVSPDAVAHGDRRFPDFDERFSPARWDADFAAAEADYIEVVRASAAEVPAIVDALTAAGLARTDGVGVAGRSYGGEISFGSVLVEPRVRAIAPIVGSPAFELPVPFSPHLHPEKYWPVPVLIQGAELDEMVPTPAMRDFTEALRPFYAAEPDRLRFIEYPGVGHALTPDLDAASSARVVEWFSRWL